MVAWLSGHASLLGWVGVLSVVMGVGTLVLAPLVVARLPVDYFTQARHPALGGPRRARGPRLLGRLGKHLLGSPGAPCSCSRGRGSSPSRSASCCSTCQGRDGSSGASSSGPLCGGRSTGYGPRRTGPRWSGPRQPSGGQVRPEPPRGGRGGSPTSSPA